MCGFYMFNLKKKNLLIYEQLNFHGISEEYKQKKHL